MGEYAKRKSDGAHIKIGTCEEMLYLRYEDRNKVEPWTGSLDAAKTLGLYWRLPFLDEDDVLPGDYEPAFRHELLQDFAVAGCENSPGVLQLSHKCGLLLNVPCYHGERLPTVTMPMRVFWNGRDPHSFALKAVKNTADGIIPIVACRWCGEAWRSSWHEIDGHLTTPGLAAALRSYRIEQSREVTELSSANGGAVA